MARFDCFTHIELRPAGTALPRRSVLFYRSPLDAPSGSVFVEIVTLNPEPRIVRLRTVQAYRLIEVFENAQLPDIDYQEYFSKLRGKQIKALGHSFVFTDGSGAVETSVMLGTKSRNVSFTAISLDAALFGSRDAEPAATVGRLIEACAAAIALPEIL